MSTSLWNHQEALYPYDESALIAWVAALGAAGILFGKGIFTLKGEDTSEMSKPERFRAGAVPVRRGAVATAQVRF